MGQDKGQVNGQPAIVQQRGDRIDAYYNTDGPNHDHLVSNDGLNADYLREGGKVIVDNSLPNPYPG